MKSAAALRQQIEANLAERIPSALSQRGRIPPERIATGIAGLDDLLLGGLPVGVLTELVGPECSGRTTMALSCLAGVLRGGRVGAWIDVADCLNPESAAASGVDLERLLWVRCGVGSKSPAAVEQTEVGISLQRASSEEPHPVKGGCGTHPRSEGAGMPEAISSLLQSKPWYAAIPAQRRDKSVGTPGAPNRPLSFRSEDRVEQVSSDRVAPRRGEQLVSARCVEPVSIRRRDVTPAKPRELNLPAREFRADRPVWQTLDQALRTTDLLLQGGGFSIIVLDLGSTPADVAWRIPLATWFRFRAACERTRVSLLVVTQHPCARSSAELVVRLGPGSMESANTVMTGIAFHAECERKRSDSNVIPIRKPPQREPGTSAGRWKGAATWTS